MPISTEERLLDLGRRRLPRHFMTRLRAAERARERALRALHIASRRRVEPLESKIVSGLRSAFSKAVAGYVEAERLAKTIR